MTGQITGFDLVIIGAGPAGMAAAIAASRAGSAVLVLDEQATPGGQVHRGIEPRMADDLGIEPRMADGTALGRDDRDGAALVETFRASGAICWGDACVWQVERLAQNRLAVEGGFRICLSRHGIAHVITARQLILATGAIERPVPIVGWTLPGVMSVGAAQILLKTGGNVPASRTVIAGQGPLVLLYVTQLLKLGIKPSAILDTTPPGAFGRALRHLPGALPDVAQLARGLGFMAAIRKAGVPVIRGVGDLKALGQSHLEQVSYLAAGRWQSMPADLLLLHEGVVPHTHLAMSMGVAHRWDGHQLCWRPVLDDHAQTSVGGLRIAGDGGGIGGWRLAVIDGTRAGLAATRALGHAPDSAAAKTALRRKAARHVPLRRFLDAWYRPRDAVLCPADEVIVCRCETTTAGDVRAAVAAGCTGPNQVKTATRCGMGPCQGRECSLTLTMLVAQARKITAEAAGHLNIRPPLKPLTLGELASLSGQAATNA